MEELKDKQPGLNPNLAALDARMREIEKREIVEAERLAKIEEEQRVEKEVAKRVNRESLMRRISNAVNGKEKIIYKPLPKEEENKNEKVQVQKFVKEVENNELLRKYHIELKDSRASLVMKTAAIIIISFLLIALLFLVYTDHFKGDTSINNSYDFNPTTTNTFDNRFDTTNNFTVPLNVYLNITVEKIEVTNSS